MYALFSGFPLSYLNQKKYAHPLIWTAYQVSSMKAIRFPLKFQFLVEKEEEDDDATHRDTRRTANLCVWLTIICDNRVKQRCRNNWLMWQKHRKNMKLFNY